MPTRYDEATITELRRAMKERGVARTPEELAQVLESADETEHDAMAERWRCDVAAHEPTARSVSRALQRDAPDRLVSIVLAHARGDASDAEIHYDVDDYVTGREGWRACHSAYGPSEPPWSAGRFASDLEREARERDLKIDPARVSVASKTVAERASRVGWYVTLPHGAERERLRAELGAIEPGPSPLAPVRAATTRFRAREIEIRQPFAARLRYVEAGRPDAPVLLLVHGHSSRLEELEDVMSLLVDAYRVVICDLPGCGYSDHPMTRYTVELYEQVLDSFLDALGITRCFMAGGSMGGNLTLRLALRRPDRIARAVAWAPVGWWRPSRLLALGARLFAEAPEHAFWVSLHEQSGSWYLPTWAGRDAALADGTAYREEVYGRAYHRAYFEIAAEQLERTMRDHAPEIRVPTMLLVGRYDEGLGMRDAVPALAAAMRAPHAIVDDAAHSIANEQPVEVARHVRAFLDAG